MAMLGLNASPPWLEESCHTLARAIDQDRLPHAVLLQVGVGQGGEWLARWLAARIYCATACGHCLSCRQVQAGEHPDLQLLVPEESTEIKIEQVRQLIEQFSLTRHGRGRKVAIISPADRLNRNAANALLKTLEEPPGEVLLILVTAKSSRLPATITSRCLRLAITPPSMTDMVQWLEASHPASTTVDWSGVLEILGPAPLTALEFDHERMLAIRDAARNVLKDALSGTLNPPVMAERWPKEDFPWYVSALERAVSDALRECGRRADTTQAKYWLSVLEELSEARRWEETPINKSLVIQRLLWRLSAVRSSLGRA